MKEVQGNYDKNWWNKGYELENPLVLSKLYNGTDNTFIRNVCANQSIWNRNYVPAGLFFMIMSNEDIRNFMQLCHLEMKDKVHNATLNQLRWLIAFGQGQTDLLVETVVETTSSLHFLLYIESFNRTLAFHPRYCNYGLFEEDMHGFLYPGLTCKELYLDFIEGKFEELKGKIIDAIKPTDTA